MSFVYTGATYVPQFVAVDGSNAILNVPALNKDYTGAAFDLIYDSENRQFKYDDENGEFAYNPANPDLGNELRITEPDGNQ